MTKSNKASDKTEELKPCPFCGGDASLIHEDYFSLIECSKCEINICENDFRARWNTRHSPVAPEDARQALEWFDEVVSLISQCMLHTTKDMDLSVEDLRHIETIRRALKELI